MSEIARTLLMGTGGLSTVWIVAHIVEFIAPTGAQPRGAFHLSTDLYDGPGLTTQRYAWSRSYPSH